MPPLRRPTEESTKSQDSQASRKSWVAAVCKTVARNPFKKNAEVTPSSTIELETQQSDQEIPEIIELDKSNYKDITADTNRDVVVEFYKPNVR